VAATDRTGRITSVAAIAALASPVRQEIIDTVEALGSATIAELAAELGRPADGLYYHVRRLVRVGLLVGRGSPEVYRTPSSRELRLDYAIDPGAVRRVIASMLRIARRDFEAGLALPGRTASGPRRTLWAGRSKGWIGAAELVEINALIARIQRILHRRRRDDRDRLASWCFVLAPVAPRPARRRSSRFSR
jgi:hypothetical protein